MFFRRHRDDDQGQAVPGRDFLNACPVKGRATMRAFDGHPLAAEPERLRRAAVEIVAKHPDASPDDVLLWAEARAVSAA